MNVLKTFETLDVKTIFLNLELFVTSHVMPMSSIFIFESLTFGCARKWRGKMLLSSKSRIKHNSISSFQEERHITRMQKKISVPLGYLWNFSPTVQNKLFSRQDNGRMREQSQYLKCMSHHDWIYRRKKNPFV